MDDIANMRLMVTAGTHQLVSVSDDRWIVLDPSGTTTFDDLIDAIEHLDGCMGSKARIAYHSGLDELIEATESADEDWLFGNSADGLWRIRSTYGTEQLWVPSRAEIAPEEVFTEVGIFGERGDHLVGVGHLLDLKEGRVRDDVRARLNRIGGS